MLYQDAQNASTTVLARFLLFVLIVFQGTPYRQLMETEKCAFRILALHSLLSLVDAQYVRLEY